MINNIDMIIKIMLLAWFLTHFEPISWIIETINPKTDNIFLLLIFDIIKLLLSCIKCCAFWSGLLIFNIWIGLAAAYGCFVYDKLFSRWETQIKVN